MSCVNSDKHLWIPIERLKLAIFWSWAKSSVEVASERPAVLNNHFCNLSNNSK